MSKNPQVPQANALFANHYRILLGAAAWSRIHPAIRQRFSGDQSAQYSGKINVFLSRAGFIFAQCCRLIGSPLAFYRGREVPIQVKVYFDAQLGGFCWDRSYFFAEGTSRVSSTKCIVGSLGLVEVLSHGFGMQLKVSEEENALVFNSVGYFWQLGQRRFTLPAIISPGTTVARQTAIDSKQFRFELSLTHPIFGRLAYQDGVFN